MKPHVVVMKIETIYHWQVGGKGERVNLIFLSSHSPSHWFHRPSLSHSPPPTPPTEIPKLSLSLSLSLPSQTISFTLSHSNQIHFFPSHTHNGFSTFRTRQTSLHFSASPQYQLQHLSFRALFSATPQAQTPNLHQGMRQFISPFH